MSKDGHNLWLVCPQCLEHGELIIHFAPRPGDVVECPVCHLIMRLAVVFEYIGFGVLKRMSKN